MVRFNETLHSQSYVARITFYASFGVLYVRSGCTLILTTFQLTQVSPTESQSFCRGEFTTNKEQDEKNTQQSASNVVDVPLQWLPKMFLSQL